jgi:group I intron endonuclease
MVGIYRITNLVNGKTYIGQSIDIKRRFCDHRCISHESNIHLKRALKKYGKDNFRYEVLEECDISELDEKEIYYISTLKPEYNIASGGQSSLRAYPEEVKKVISQKAKAQWERMTDEEKRYRIEHNLKGQPKGHPVSAETREKLRDENLGKKQSAETINKRKQTFIEKKKNGYVQTNAGHRKKIICVETGEIFDSVKETGEHLNVNPSNISHVLKGRQKSVKGYHFEYLEV